ncbi:autotransporter-associated beta strand repeat-containing protein [Luteolibacter arcticus]|uniref:Autotransporter-associated beta strand repeat-containing protein n=1 Tax=Luteolibacter arcticus TaxID=1581411 RepID=A0ABT3GLN2_9BACT|nr:autotransporter-associated beta strand repeat-containing protein [Luteolibacter arcticus]MCW1924430.1 autotransporter-associated beta strand repeat-containing protein [Luteolibacter arcticus]
MKNLRLHLLSLFAPLALSPFVTAAPVNWSAQAVGHADLAQPADVTGVSTAGTLVAAVDVGGTGATVNGVPFAAGNGNISLSTCNWSVPSVTWGNNFGGYYSTSGAAPVHSDNTWLSTGKYGNGTSNVGTLNLFNLTVGHSYAVQLFLADLRTAQDGFKVIVDGGSPNQFAFSPGGGPWGYLMLTGTFIADAPTQAITMRNTNPSGGAFNTQLNAFQYRDLGVGEVALPPTFNPVAGTYVGAQTVTISCASEGATIHYTTDGSAPTIASPSGTSPVAVNVPAGTTMTIQAIGHVDGWADSSASSASYTTLATSSGVWTQATGGSWGATGNWQGGTIPFGGTADFSTLALPADATVTLDGARTIGHLVFGDTGSSHDWQVTSGSGGALTLDTGSVTSSVAVNNGTTTIDTVVAGTHGLAKSGNGNLELTGPNTFTGASSVEAGTLTVTNLASHRSSVDIASGAAFVAEVASEVLAPNSFNITGTGTLVKTGAGTWMLGNAGRVGIAMGAGGLIDVQEGVVSTGSHQNSWTGNLASMNLASGATIDLPAENIWVDALTGSGSIINSYAPSGGRTVNVGVADGSGTFSGTIASGGLLALTKAGTGTQIFTGTHTYTGTTTINGGTLQIGNGGTTGSLATGSGIVTNGTLAFNRSDAISQGTHFSGGNIGGTGGLTQMGPGKLTLTANNSYAGTTAVTGGELAIGLAPGTKWDVQHLDLAAGTTLSLDNFDSESGNAAVDAIQTLTTAGTVTLKVSGNFTVGTFPLIWYQTGTEIGGAGYAAFALAPLPSGVTGHLAHDAESSTVTLVVEQVVVSPFQSWISTSYPSLSGDDALPGADPDDDGMSNLDEFAFMGDPTSGSDRGPAKGLAIDTNSNGSKELNYTVAVRSGAAFTGSPSLTATVDGVTYTIQGSTNLTAFTAAVNEVVPALTPAQTGLPDITEGGWEYRTFKLTGSEGLVGKGFLRAQAEAP